MILELNFFPPSSPLTSKDTLGYFCLRFKDYKRSLFLTTSFVLGARKVWSTRGARRMLLLVQWM